MRGRCRGRFRGRGRGRFIYPFYHKSLYLETLLELGIKSVDPYNGLRPLPLEALANPGKLDIKCHIQLSTHEAIQRLADEYQTTVGAMARSLWHCGVVVIMARHLGDDLPAHLKPIAIAMPDLAEEARGDQQIKFSAREKDLERMKLVAFIQDKKTAQLHRNALAIGVWVYERISIVEGLVDDASQSQ